MNELIKKVMNISGSFVLKKIRFFLIYKLKNIIVIPFQLVDLAHQVSYRYEYIKSDDVQCLEEMNINIF